MCVANMLNDDQNPPTCKSCGLPCIETLAVTNIEPIGGTSREAAESLAARIQGLPQLEAALAAAEAELALYRIAVPMVITCDAGRSASVTCGADADFPTIADATNAGWKGIQIDNGASWNFIGTCPECAARDKEQP